MDFIRAVSEFSFLQYALLGGLLASIAAGMIGSYVVARRISSIAGSIAHAVLGGMGVARYLQLKGGWTYFTPLWGALIAAIIAAVIIGLVSLKARQREDTVLNAIWAIGMAIGILFIFKTPGYTQDLMSYLFGNILMITRQQLTMLAILDGVVLFFSVLLYRPFLAICFDEEFSRIRGVPVDFFFVLLLILTALTVVVLSVVVGIIMVIALLTLPAAIASQFSKRMWKIMLFSTITSALFTTSGLALSYRPNLPAGATIILVAGCAYLLSLLGRALRRKQRHARML